MPTKQTNKVRGIVTGTVPEGPALSNLPPTARSMKKRGPALKGPRFRR